MPAALAAAAMVICALIAAAPAGATTISVSGDAERITVRAEGPVNLVASYEDGTGTRFYSRDAWDVRPPCVQQDDWFVVCPGPRRLVDIAIGPFDDYLRLKDVPARLDLGAGDDFLDINHDRDVQLRGGPGYDEISLPEARERITLGRSSPVRTDGVAVDDFERITGGFWPLTVYATVGQTVAGNSASDFINVRNGGKNWVDCVYEVNRWKPFDSDNDVVVADREDELDSCGDVRLPPPYLLLPDPRAYDPQSPWRRLGVRASPQHDGGSVALTAVTYPGAFGSLTATASSWRGAERLALAPAEGRADGTGQMGFDVQLTPAVIDALAREGRLRVRASARYELEDAVEERTATFTLVGTRVPAQIHDGRRARGGFGSQRLVGTARGDQLDGVSADDVLLGRNGTDTLRGGSGNDLLRGGAGADALNGDDGDDRLSGGPGDDDLIELRFGHDRLDGGDGDDVLRGARGPDELFGGPGDDVLDGGSGRDRVDCGPGEDVVAINSPGERALLKNCEEVQDGSGVLYRRCTEAGTEVAEMMLGTDGDDTCSGGLGDDDLEGAGGDDILKAGPGNDRLFGRFGRDLLRGEAGNDELEGGRGVDVLHGGAGDDQLNGGYGRDRLFGGTGRDRLTARGGGLDRLDCGPGRDVAFVDSRDRVRGCERVDRSGGRK